MDNLLGSLGINIASSAIYEIIKSGIKSAKSKEELIEIVASKIMISNADVAADRIIEFAAINGDIIIDGTNIYAGERIIMQSKSDTKFTFGNDSTSKTSTTQITAGQGAKIEGSGGAKIEQHSDGSIRFST